MLSESLAKARAAIDADLGERRKLFRHEVDRIKQEMAALGLLSSGPTIERVRRLCDGEIEERAQVVVKCLLGTIQADGIVLTESLAKGLKDEARKHLTPEPADLVAAYQEVTRGLPGFEKKRQSFARTYSEALGKIDGEIDRQAKQPPVIQTIAPAVQPSPAPVPPRSPALPVTSSPPSQPLKPQAPAKPASTPPAAAPSAPVASPSAARPVAAPSPPQPQVPASSPERAMPSIVLPSGPPAEIRRTVPPEPSAPSSASAATAARPSIPAAAPAEANETEDQKRLAEALAGLRHEVGKRSWLGGFPRDEVIQLIAEAQAEVNKERPNRFRFSAVGSAIAALPETPAALRAVYTQLKEVLAPFGVKLP